MCCRLATKFSCSRLVKIIPKYGPDTLTLKLEFKFFRNDHNQPEPRNSNRMIQPDPKQPITNQATNPAQTKS